MSWEEYKKKQNNENNERIVQDNYQSQNSWEEYKYKTKQLEMQKLELQRLEEEKRKQQETQEKQKSQKLKQQSSKINSVSRNNNQGLNNSKFQALENKELKYTAPNFLEKSLNISDEEAKKIYNESTHENNKVLTKLSNSIKDSPIGNSPGGKAVKSVVDAVRDIDDIAKVTKASAVKGGAELVSYANKLDDKLTQKMKEIGLPDGMAYGRYSNIYTGENIGKNVEALANNRGKIASGEMSYDDVINKVEKVSIEDSYNAKQKATEDMLQGIKDNADKEIQEGIENTHTKLTKKVAELASSAGNNLTGMAITAIDPVVGTSYFIGSAAGSYYDDAINRGMNEDQALVYGGIMGTMEGLTEQIPIGKMLGAGKNIGKTTIKNTLKEYGISMAENAIQEAVIEPISEVSAYAIGGKETAKDLDFSDFHIPKDWKSLKNWVKDSPNTINTLTSMASRMLKSGVDGALSAVLLSGVNAGVNSAVNLQNKIANKEQITAKEVQQCMQDIQKSGKVDVEETFKKEMQYQAQKAKSTYYDYNTGEKVDDDTQNILNQAEDIIRQNNVQNIEENVVDNQNSTQNLKQNATKNQNNTKQQHTSTQNIETPLNSNVEGQNDYINSAQKYNIDTNNQSVRKIGELANKRGINITYDDSLFKNNPNANAIYQTKTDENGNVTRNIILNPNANTNRTLEQIELHEIVHDMYGTESFNKIKEMVLDYDKSKAGYQEARAGLEELYSQVYDKNSSDFQSLVDEEAVADILGNKLGDQQFVNELVNMKESRSIARRIYDWVVERLNNITRRIENMNSYFYWKDVKNKFEVAFRQEYQGKNTNVNKKYSMQESENNSGSFNLPKTDNKGRILSQKQQEFFKDSKIKDKDGNLKTMYHGSNNEFTIFEHGKAYEGTSNANVGYWFTESAEGAKKFADSVWYGDTESGSKVYEVYLNMKNPKIYENIDNALELKNIDSEIDKLKATMRKLENKNIAIEINKQELRWATSNEELQDIAKYEGIDFEDAKKYHNAINKYNELEEDYDNKKYNDSYEQFRTDIYKIAGKNASDANFGGGMYLENKEQIINKYVADLKEQGYDGIIIKNTRFDSETLGLGKDNSQYIVFDSSQIKNVDNKNPTSSNDIRYSTNSHNAWQEHLDKNYKNNNKGTRLQDVKLPTKETVTEKQRSTENKADKVENDINGYANAARINKAIRNRESQIEKINDIIKVQSELLNKTQKLEERQNIQKIINQLKAQKKEIKNSYNKRIERLYKEIETNGNISYEEKEQLNKTVNSIKKTRTEIQEQLLSDTGLINENFDDVKNLSMLNINRTDPIRLQEKVFGNKLGKKINETIFNKVKHNTAEKTRFLNKERNEIKSWNIKPKSFESEILQKYTEKTYVNKEGKETKYTDADLKRDIKDVNTRNKIIEASKKLREKYDMYIDKANEVLMELGYDAIPKRKDYVRHFTELNDIFSKYGIPIRHVDDLPTDINGITDTFRPGKNFFANTQRRYTNKTAYDAITGIDGYLDGIGNLIYHTEDIQRLRAFDKFIRNRYGEKGFENLENLSDVEKQKRIENISKNHLSNYVSWLTEYTNNLAGKKSGIDRSAEKLVGRKIYSALNMIKKQTGSNMTGFNVGSALTNFISVVQGASKTKKMAVIKGLCNTVKNIKNNDGFVDKSDFLTNRFGSDKLSKTIWEKASNAGQIFMSATDYFSSNLIVRSKYLENLAKGMNESEAMKNADDFGARILGDRSQGATANIFNSRLLGIVTQFQLETNNQMDTFIHDTSADFKTTLDEKGAIKASMGAVWTLGQLAVGQYVFNNIFESLFGSRPAFDIIHVLLTALGIGDDEDDDTVVQNLQEAGLELLLSLPFVNLLSENSRVPIASAVPNLINVAIGETTLEKELPKLMYLLPPTGGSQIRKSIDGIKTVIDGGSYVINSKGEKELRFPVEDVSATDYIRAGIFGKYSLPLAKEYVNRDYKRLTAKQTTTYQEANLPFKEYLKYLDAGLKTNEEKIEYLNSEKLTIKQKWGIYKNDIFNSEERQDGTSQVTDAEFALGNNMASEEEYIELYNTCQAHEIDMPDTKELQNLLDQNIQLDTYVDYRVKVAEKTISQRKAGEIEKNEGISDKSKMKILIDSKYDNSEKASIYENYIGTQDELYSVVMKNTGININEYLKYKTQEFTSDKEDDGTVDGKSVRGSEKKKVYEYVNNMKITGEQRLLLLGTRYKLTNSERTTLAQYVKNLDITNKEKLEIYKKLQGFTVYKDGRVTF